MNGMEAVLWIASVCVGMRRSQIKTLGDLVSVGIQIGRVSLAELGRLLAQDREGVAKHCIKRAWRFTANGRVHVSDAMQGPLRWLFHSRKHWKKHPLLVTFDWTEVRSFHTLMAAAVIRGRGVPLLWASYEEWVLYKSQNNLEEGLLWLLKSLLPEWITVIVVADRGFGRTELARTCQQMGFHYVIRIKPDVHIECRKFRGRLDRLPVKRGTQRLLEDVQFRKENPVTQHVAVCWKKGLPKDRDECWFLMTDLARSVKKLTDMYGRRMTIEELFRDEKNRRHGWALRNTQITRPERFDRLLLILSLAYWLLIGVGLIALKRYSPAMWCSNNRPGTCGLFFIGRKMTRRLELPAAQALSALLQAILAEAGKWG
jgi:Transposase DDE domain